MQYVACSLNQKKVKNLTLVTAWVRRTQSNEELVVASDSRVTGGLALDHSPKLFRLERNDAVLAYCGPTLVAYPILLQIKSSLDAHDETRERIIDIVDLKAHIEKTIERLRAQIRDLPSKDDTHRSFKFLLAGYSWKYARFRAWVFRYDIKTGEFNAFSMPRKGKHQFVFMSDYESNEERAKKDVLRRCYRSAGGPLEKLGWEPLETLISIINDEGVRDIGGPPQIIKIYKHGNTLPINVLWPEDKIENGLGIRKFEVTHLGRPLLGYERTRLLTPDPEDGDLVEPWRVRERVNCYNEREEQRLRASLLLDVARRLAWRRNTLALQEELTAMIKSGCSFSQLQTAMAAAKNW